MAVQKLNFFCKAEKREIFALRKIILNSTRKNSQKKFDRLTKYIFKLGIDTETTAKKTHVH
jgi:hypothetical protein